MRKHAAIGEERDLFHQALVVDRDWQARFLKSLEKGGPIFFYDLGMQAADFLDLFPHRFQASNQVFGQMFAFAFAHFD